MIDVAGVASNPTAESISALKQAQTRDAVATRVLKLSNDQQDNVLALLEGAVQSAQQIQQSGCGDCVDVQA